MPLDKTQITEFLKKSHLFKGLSDDQLSLITSEMEDVFYQAGDAIYNQAEKSDYFYLIYSGNVLLSRSVGDEETKVAVMVPGDFFGEEVLIPDRPRSEFASVLEDVTLIRVSQKNLPGILKQVETLKQNLDISLASRKISKNTRFTWLHEGETIKFITRKHPILLWRSLTAPLIALIFVLFFILVGLTFFSGTVTWWIAGLLLIAISGWSVWNVIDWGNDYYIVTNQRVLYLEKIIGLYESRQEAPMENIVSVGVETDAVGRALNYGAVIVRTYVGRVVLNHVNHPYQAAAIVEEQWTRVKEVSRKAEVSLIRKAIRSRLFPDQNPPAIEAPEPANELVETQPLKWFNNFFRMRFENTSTTTYRKHWFVLLKRIWLPSVILFSLFAYIIFQLLSTNFGFVKSPDGQSFLGLWAAILFVVVIWWIYQYMDWSNDIYQVNPEQILDIHKKPLGRETRKAAPLDNILSTEYKRIGILGIMFNYGNVYITIGGSQLEFTDVFDPAAVQDDIDRRRLERVAKKREEALVNERERMADWITEYHNTTKSNFSEPNSEEDFENPDPF